MEDVPSRDIFHFKQKLVPKTPCNSYANHYIDIIAIFSMNLFIMLVSDFLK
jgi:hypothetical protein